MNKASVFHDEDLVKMLIEEPELLAVADALVETKAVAASAASGSRLRSRNWRSTRLVAAAVAVPALVAAMVLLVLSPWGGTPGFADRALAAIGSGPVLHVVLSQPDSSDRALVEIRSGAALPRTLRTEIWFDRDRGLKRTVSSLDGRVLDTVLETKQGGRTQTGPVYTCAWIAAHPVEATKAGVSCSASGENGTTPRSIPARAPELDPAVAGFLDGYRSALAAGDATRTGTGTLEGHDVLWLQFDANGLTEQVAIDATTYKPLLIREGDEVAARVVTAETLPFSSSYFTKPEQVQAQTGGSVASERNVTPQQAASVVGGRALWLGEQWRGLRLVATSHQVRTIGYGSDQAPDRADVVDLVYAPVAADGTVDTKERIEILEASRCVLTTGWTCTPRDPATNGTLERFGPISLLRQDGLYISIWNLGDQQEVLELARALTPIPIT